MYGIVLPVKSYARYGISWCDRVIIIKMSNGAGGGWDPGILVRYRFLKLDINLIDMLVRTFS
jgi:hypothetical protein